MAGWHKGFGWTRDLPDHRDFVYEAPRVPKTPPPLVDLRPESPRIYNQGKLHSCTANAIAAAIQYARATAGLPDLHPSRLFIYYNARALERKLNCDAGVQIRNGLKCIRARGVCPEHLWPYQFSRFDTPPGRRCFRAASDHRHISYHRIRRHVGTMKACLASGEPFAFGFVPYTNMTSPGRSGVVTLPRRGEHRIGDGHVVLAVGYDDARQRFLVRNSWGVSWGLRGYFWLPYQYLEDEHLSGDFWVVRVTRR